MMQTFKTCAPIAAALSATLSLLVSVPAQANVFGSREIPSDRIIAVTSPYGENQHQLLVIQQLESDRQCWREISGNPTQVDPLLVNFDFTGICGRSIDSNGYSIRLANQDLGWRYSLRIVKRDGDMLLLGSPTGNKNAPELLIGQVGGSYDGFAKIQLNPGWRMTQRTYAGTTLGHIYFTHDQSLTAFTVPAAEQSVSRLPGKSR